MAKRVAIDGLEFDPITQVEMIERIDHVIAGPKRRVAFRVVKPYVEFFEKARQDPTVHQAIMEADLIVADSVAVVWAAAWLAEHRQTVGRFVWSLAVGLRRPAWLTGVIPERGEGATATHELLLAAAQHGWRIGIIGGPDDQTALREAIMERYPLLQLEGVWSGYYDTKELNRTVKSIAAAKLDILFVAMGFPKQELFMSQHLNLARVLIGEGGTFDYDEMGGRHRRAPKWLRRAGLEWLWRLILQPTRLGRMLAIPRFMWRIFMISRRPPKSPV